MSADRIRPVFAAALLGSVLLAGPALSSEPAQATASARSADGASTAPTADDPPLDPTSHITWAIGPVQEENQPQRSSFFLDADPGATLKDSLFLKNIGDQPATLTLYPTDARNNDKGELELFAAAEKPTDIGTWIELEKDEITLKPREEAKIPFTLKVPEGAEPGDHTGGLVSSYLAPSTDANGQAVLLDQRLASRVALRVSGPLKPAMTISDVSATYGGSLNPAGRGHTDLTYRLHNDGNVRLSAQQILKAKGMVGLITRTATLEPIPELLPGNSMIVTTSMSGVWPTIRSTAQLEVRPIPTRPGDSFPALKSARASSADWAIPWSLLVVLALAGGGAATFLRLRARGQERVQQQIDDAVEADRAAALNGSATSPQSVGGGRPDSSA